MTDEIKNGHRRVPGYDEDFYPDNRIRRDRARAFGSRTRVYGRDMNGIAFDTPSSSGNENNSEKVADKGKRKVGEAIKEAGQRKRFIERRRGLILAGVFILLFAAILGLIYKLVFVVKAINITGSEKYTNEEILQGAGISEGINLYSFRGSVTADRITLHCPYISAVNIDREIPSTVNITATEDKAAYYTIIYGEYKLLSEGLRVLETVEADALPEGITKLKLPSVSYAVAGRVIEFTSERRTSDITELLKIVRESPFKDRLTVIDVRDRYDISMICDGKNKLVLGENEDADYKLRVAEKVLEDPMFASENKFRIDLTIRGKTGVVMDNLLDVN